MRGTSELRAAWNRGDLEAFILQAGPRNLFKQSTVILTAGETAMFRMGDKIPDGTVLGARGTHGWGTPDASGYAALGCNEMLVHARDIAGAGLERRAGEVVEERRRRSIRLIGGECTWPLAAGAG